jgi:SAM-dependent methyltransferase
MQRVRATHRENPPKGGLLREDCQPYDDPRKYRLKGHTQPPISEILSPLVPSAPAKLLSVFPAGKLIEDWQKTFEIDITKELIGIQEIALYRCEASGVDFFMPSEAAGSEKLYQKLQKFDWFYMQDKWEFNRAIKDLEYSRKVLEIGSGPGFFLERAIRDLTGIQMRGIELNQAAYEEARLKGLPVEYRTLEEIAAGKDLFDAVCCFQVLEHVVQPRLFLETMVQVLSPAGLLILSVPNRESFLEHQCNLLDLPPHHMTRWNAYSFKYLEKLFPLSIVRILYEPLARYHVAGYVSAYAQFWSHRLSFIRHFARERQIHSLAGMLERSGLYHFLRGQSMYVVFKKI